MADRQLVLPEVVVPGRRLGRHIHHDPRSVAYRVGRTATPKTVAWPRRIPILDQGQLGSCTGNATVGCLGTEPFYSTLTPTVQAKLDESLAVSIYSGGTGRDDVPGAYPPQDTGSTGLAVAQEAKARGLVSGYQHIMSLGEAYASIQEGPFIFGGSWTSGMDHPDHDGVVAPTGSVRGGHEWLFREYDASTGHWLCDNSWGPTFGVAGSFRLSDASFQWLLDQQGDATVLVPLTKPAPVPVPVPTPPHPSDPTWALWQKQVAPVYKQWLAHPLRYRRPLATAINLWSQAVD